MQRTHESIDRPRASGRIPLGIVAIAAVGAMAIATVIGFSVDSGRHAAPSVSEAGKTLLAVAVPGIAQAAPSASTIERGKYLVTILGCNDCHTPFKMGPHGPEPDMTKMLSGHPAGLVPPPPPKLDAFWMWAGAGTMTAFHGPWGTSFSPNLTPDEETGIGAWDEQLFISAIRSGKIKGGGRPILPPMPWPWYSKMTDDDLKAVFAYLMTIPAIKNQAPEPTPPADHGAGGAK